MKWLTKLRSKFRKACLQKPCQPKYVDLMPVIDADEYGHYSEALQFAIDSSRIRNIAVTGPYGSGKSSIIQTFEAKTKSKFLNISLACFKEEIQSSNEKEEQERQILVERSILQQLLYGVEANKLPFSRFKRIRFPRRCTPWMLAGGIILWLLAIAYFYSSFRYGFLDIDGSSFDSLVTGILAIWSLLGPLLLIGYIYRSSFKYSFTKISLSNAEIETGEVSDNSVLSRHLDEIIYFFQACDFNVVVFEDLDRFCSPEIFVKLREINKLINDNPQVKWPVKFIYALKDHMFANKDRTKFFDFIIPVVPVINSTNALEKLTKRLPEKTFTSDSEKRFLREVSLHLNDLRLIHNIVNEFHLYYAQLSSESIDVTKLLAILIYKNVYPKDFESLHLNKGVVYQVVHAKNDIIDKLSKKYKDEISDCESELKNLEKEVLANEKSLVQAFIGNIVSAKENVNLSAILVSDSQISFAQFTKEDIAKLRKGPANAIHLYSPYVGRVDTGKTAKQIEEELCPNSTFEKRFERIRQNATHTQAELQSQITAAHKSLQKIRLLRLKELIAQSSTDIIGESSANELQGPDSTLLVYLIRNGHIDESYLDYISVFYEGSMTRNDHEFLIKIRGFETPESTYLIDSPKEVCQEMRKEDFSLSYVLNIKIFDFLLKNQNRENKERLKDALTFISENFDSAQVFVQVFMRSYFELGNQVSALVKSLSKVWPDYGSVAIQTNDVLLHIRHILRDVSPSDVASAMNKEGVLTQYLKEHAFEVYTNSFLTKENLAHLKELNVCFEDLKTIAQTTELLSYVHDNNLYAITVDNLRLLLMRLGNGVTEEDCEIRNYTTIFTKGTEKIQGYVDSHISEYVNDVFLTLPKNGSESPEIILALLEKEQLDLDQKQKIIHKKSHVFNELDGIPDSLWFFVFLQGKVLPTWKNIFQYQSSSAYKEDDLIQILSTKSIVDRLVRQPFNSNEIGKESSEKIANFFGNADKIPDDLYIKLVEKIPFIWNRIPDSISEKKILLLAQHGKLDLNDQTFAAIKYDRILQQLFQAALIENQIDDYLKKKNQFPVNDAIRGMLLQSSINESQKLAIACDLDFASIESDTPYLTKLVELLLSPKCDLTSFHNRLIQKVIACSKSVQTKIPLLEKAMFLFDKTTVLKLISSFPEPFDKISKYDNHPTIENTFVNRRFAKVLQDYKIISSVKLFRTRIVINTYKSADSMEGAEE